MDSQEDGLRAAVERGDEGAVKDAIANGRSLSGELLHAAAKVDQPEITALLIDNDVAVDTRDAEGRTPLWHAARARAHATAECLCRAGADADLADAAGRTPLMMAASHGGLPTVRLLLGLEPQEPSIGVEEARAALAERGISLSAAVPRKNAKKVAAARRAQVGAIARSGDIETLRLCLAADVEDSYFWGAAKDSVVTQAMHERRSLFLILTRQNVFWFRGSGDPLKLAERAKLPGNGVAMRLLTRFDAFGTKGTPVATEPAEEGTWSPERWPWGAALWELAQSIPDGADWSYSASPIFGAFRVYRSTSWQEYADLGPDAPPVRKIPGESVLLAMGTVGHELALFLDVTSRSRSLYVLAYDEKNSLKRAGGTSHEKATILYALAEKDARESAPVGQT